MLMFILLAVTEVGVTGHVFTRLGAARRPGGVRHGNQHAIPFPPAPSHGRAYSKHIKIRLKTYSMSAVLTKMLCTMGGLARPAIQFRYLQITNKATVRISKKRKGKGFSSFFVK
jgi:hypothetical protein